MLLSQLEGFVATARERGVSRAAEKLYISQPALSARLQSLERELGTALLVRTPRGVRLSEAGKVFLPYAQRVLDATAEGRKRLDQLCAGETGRLALATAPGLLTSVLPPMLKRFREAFPNIPVTIRTSHPEGVFDHVLREEVQLGFACNVEHPELESIPLHEDELVCVLASDHPAATADEISLTDIASEQLIMFRESSLERLLSELLHRSRIPTDAVLELDSIDAAKKMVENGLGVAFLPLAALEVDDIESRRLTFRRLREKGPLPLAIMALRRRDAGPLIGPAAHFLRPEITGSHFLGPEISGSVD